MRTTMTRLGMVALVASLFSACIEKDAPPPPPEPPPAPPPEPARSALSVDANGAYTIVAVGANKCVQFAGGRMDDAVELQIAACNGSKAQQFKLVALPGGYYSIRNAASGKCIDVQNSS